MALKTEFVIFPGSQATETRWLVTTTSSFLTNRTHSLTNPADPQVEQALSPLEVEALLGRA
jgi:hypothetical protein